MLVNSRIVAELGPCLGLLLLSGLLLAGCASSRSVPEATSTTNQSWSSEETESRLRSAAERWEGVEHKLGGSSRSGVDCSGLVQSVFREEFQVSVPRTTEKQARTGKSVSRSSLRPGDLVFFRPERKKRHVGIYLSDGEFLHASSSEGVTISPLDRSYWTDHWWQARRLFSPSEESDTATARTADSPDRTESSAEVGW